jgi:anti-sigma B factor antagonist
MTLPTRTHGQVRILELSGRFDAHMAPKVKEWQDRADASAYTVVNLRGVSFIDSAALAALVRGMKRCRQQGGDLRLCDMQQPVRIIFEMTKLDKAFTVFDTEDEAIRVDWSVGALAGA